MAEFRMPSLGSDMQAGTLVEWLVKPGDAVRRRDVVAIVDTDKAAIEIEIYEDGVVESLLVEQGQKVPVGTIMAIINTETTRKTDSMPEEKQSEEAVSSLKPEDVSAIPSEPGEKPSAPSFPAAKRMKVSPYARRLAAERGVNLSSLTGSGPEGAICAADIEHAGAAEPSASPGKMIDEPGMEKDRAPSQPAPGGAAPEVPAARDYRSAMRRAIAAAMARSKREIPHYYLQTRIDMSRSLQWLASENELRPVKERILPAALLIKAVALALTDVPELNGYWIDGGYQAAEAVHVGFVISLRQGGIVAPALLHVDEMSIDELMAALRDLIQRTRSGGLRSSEMTEATITVTSLGDRGVETVYGIIYPPQIALVGFGKITEQPWAENGMIGARKVVTATLAADHRVTDGHRGARFLEALNRYLQEPSTP